MEVRCKQDCYDGPTGWSFKAGEVHDIDPMNPIAAYFEWPEGVEHYVKVKVNAKVETQSDPKDALIAELQAKIAALESQKPAPPVAEGSTKEEVKAQLDSLGVKYHPATGLDKLKAKLAEATAQKTE